MRELLLTNSDEVALVDNDVYPQVSASMWSLNNSGYVVGAIGGRATLLHRFVLGLVPGDGIEGDHRNGDKLNNLRDNLRVATRAQNSLNRRPQAGSKSRFKGVNWYARTGRWRAEYRGRHLGYFDEELDAARAYDRAAVADGGEFAMTNALLGLLEEVVYA